MRAEKERATGRRTLEHRTTRRASDFGVLVADLRPLRLGALHGMMEEIAADERGLSLRVDPERNVTGRVARRRLKHEPITEILVFPDDVRETGVEDRAHRLRPDALDGDSFAGAAPVDGTPGVEVTGILESGDPHAILKPRIPARVIGVQVRVHHRVDVFG